MAHRFEGPVLLDEHRFGIAELVNLSGAPEGSVENWQARRVATLGVRLATGRRVYSLLDVIRVAAMNDLTRRTRMAPSDAVLAAELLARYVADHSPRDQTGRPIADFNAIAPTLAYALAPIDGEMCVGLIDPTRPGYLEHAGPYGRAHVVLPIVPLLADLLLRLLAFVNAQTPEAPK